MAIRKPPLRVLRVAILLFIADFLRGSAAQRRRFVGAVTYRVAGFIGLRRFSDLIFTLRRVLARHLRVTSRTPDGREKALWRRATSGLVDGEALRAWGASPCEGGPRIIVMAAGSVGDVLQMTPLLRALRAQFTTAQIWVLHRSPAAKMVLRDNSNINGVVLADPHHFEQIRHAVGAEGGADLLVDVQNISFVVTYIVAPIAERHRDLAAADGAAFLAAAMAAQSTWQGQKPIFPRRDERFAWPEATRGLHYLDVMGASAHLPIDRESALDFATDEGDGAVVDALLPRQSFVTVQNGVDAFVMTWSKATGQRPTKLLPMATWEATVRSLQAERIAVVQIGTMDDEPIRGVDGDLRGRTTLRQAAVILQRAVCHVGIEGGLVHLARAVGARAVVAFGPTSANKLGYPHNANLVASECHSCWWTTKDWHTYCPRGLAEPECMTAFTPAMITEEVLAIARGAAPSDRPRAGLHDSSSVP